MLPPELATLDAPLGGIPISKGGLLLIKVLEYCSAADLKSILATDKGQVSCEMGENGEH